MNTARERQLKLWLTVLLLTSLTQAGIAAEQGLSSQYPGDVGIRNDSRVHFVEDFEKASTDALKSAWPDYKNPTYTSLVSDVPAASSGAKSLLLDGSRGSSHWYRNLDVGERVFVRYYIKYERGKYYHHTGPWIGGYDPPTPWPQGNAGRRQPPDTFFSIAPEVLEGVNTASGGSMSLAFYNYFMNMNPDPSGVYWGENIFLGDRSRVPTEDWTCIEYMVKLNNPVSAKNGELALWINGEKIIHFGEGYPNGVQSYGVWRPDPNGEPYKGLQFRDDPNWGVNYLWLLNDPPSEHPGSPSGKIWVDDLVVASEYIGPISATGSTPPPEPPPAPEEPPDPDPAPTGFRLESRATVSGSQVVVDAAVEGGTGPYQFLFDCGSDGNWNGVVDTAQPSARHVCLLGGRSSLRIKTWVWDRTQDDQQQQILDVTADGGASVLGPPGRPQLIVP